MVTFPNAKINIGLQITGKRKDGYHNLQTVFYPVDLKDALEIIPTNINQPSEIKFTQTGLPIDGNPKDNICIKAYQILKRDFPNLPIIQMHLHKCIPMGAGLGGGSADGCYTLKMLNEKFKLGISDNKLHHYALELGSDSPFFVHNKPAFASGRGEILEEIELDLSAYEIKITCPGIHISTADAYSEIRNKVGAYTDLKTVVRSNPDTWKNLIKNDFEETIFKRFPSLAKTKDDFYRKGAVYASMSGSGSAIYALFRKG